jgi:hypothetical protein
MTSGMTRDRREDKNLTQDEVKKILSRKQLAALLECQYFGWRVKFIRRPLFQKPVPVLYNAKFDLIGVLELDGHINLDIELEVRSHKPDQTKQPPQVQKAVDAVSWKEKRKEMVPVPDNLGELLNQNQMRTLRQIKKFGWQLHFVRRPSFQEPIAVIINPEGDKFATLETDGRIKVTTDLTVRKEAPVEQAESAPFVPATKIKRAK